MKTLKKLRVFIGALCLKMREPFLNETDAPPRRSLPLATQQKSFLFLLEEKRSPPNPFLLLFRKAKPKSAPYKPSSSDF